MNCQRCGTEVKDGHDLCPDCEYHLEYHENRCVECVPRIERDGQDYWRGYHSRDHQIASLGRDLMKFKRLLKEAQDDR